MENLPNMLKFGIFSFLEKDSLFVLSQVNYNNYWMLWDDVGTYSDGILEDIDYDCGELENDFYPVAGM